MPLKKKQSFRYLTYKTVCRLFSAQITGAAIYLLMGSLTVILFSDEDGKVLKIYEWIPLVVGVLTELRLVNIHMYRLGEEHYTTGVIARQPKAPIWGFYVGLMGISPILFFWFLMILGFIFSFSVSGFQNLVGYFLYPWSPYFDLVRSIVPQSSFWGVLFYIPPMLPIPILSYFSFKGGIEDKPINLKFWEYRSNRQHKMLEEESQDT